MSEISVAELYDLYLDTIGRCTSELLQGNDEELRYNLFEEFDIGAHSFLHDDNLTKLWHAGYIDDEMVKVSREVRGRWLALQTKVWEVEEIRNSKEWKGLFELCDQLELKLRPR